MEYQDKKPRRKREDRQEIGRQLLIGSVIGEIDRLAAIGELAARTAEIYRQIFDNLKGYKLQVDTDALDAREKKFTDALEKQIKQIRAATGDGSHGLMADDRHAVPLFRNRLLLPGNPSVEGEIPATGAAVQGIATGSASATSDETDQEKEIKTGEFRDSC